MQAELQERRQWVPKARFVEGLSLANLLPGAPATQLGIFLGYARGGWWGGVLGGLSFVLPGFAIMLALTLVYAALGVTPIMRGALSGLGPVVLGIYAVAVYRLGRSTLESPSQGILAVAAAIAAFRGPLGPAAILLLGGGIGLLLFHSRRLGAAVLLALTAALIAWPYAARVMPAVVALPPGSSRPAGLFELGALLFTIGAFTFGGGLSMIALIQDQMVQQLHWLTPQQFLDGLALGQFTPGPILMVAAYVGYTIAGLTGAVVGAAAAFLPSFVLMLALLPVFDRVRALGWARAVLRRIGPAVIGVLAVSLLHLAPHALVDPFAVVLLGATVIALVYWRVASLKLMLAGSVLGVLRGRLAALQVVRSLLSVTRL